MTRKETVAERTAAAVAACLGEVHDAYLVILVGSPAAGASSCQAAEEGQGEARKKPYWWRSEYVDCSQRWIQRVADEMDTDPGDLLVAKAACRGSHGTLKGCRNEEIGVPAQTREAMRCLRKSSGELHGRRVVPDRG